MENCLSNTINLTDLVVSRVFIDSPVCAATNMPLLGQKIDSMQPTVRIFWTKRIKVCLSKSNTPSLTAITSLWWPFGMTGTDHTLKPNFRI